MFLYGGYLKFEFKINVPVEYSNRTEPLEFMINVKGKFF